MPAIKLATRSVIKRARLPLLLVLASSSSPPTISAPDVRLTSPIPIESSGVPWSDATTITAEPGKQTRLNSYRPPEPYLHVDAAGAVHLFWHRRAGGGPVASDDSGIQHSVLSKNGWVRQPPVSSANNVRLIRAGVGPEGMTQIVWCEEQGVHPDYHPRRLYIQLLTDYGWSQAERVSDPKAVPSCIFRDDVDAAADRLGAQHVVWTDWREKRFWANLFSGEGDVPKTFHRVKSGASWDPVERVQPRGNVPANSAGLSVSAVRPPILTWFEKRNALVVSQYEESRWSKPFRLEINRNEDTYPGEIISMDSVEGAGGSVQVAWIEEREGERSNQRELLRYITFSDGQWSHLRLLSEQASDLRWGSGTNGAEVLGVQEDTSSSSRMAHLPTRDLSVITFINGEPRGRQLIAHDVIEGLFDIAVDHDGGYHAVYVTIDATDEIVLLHRTRPGVDSVSR